MQVPFMYNHVMTICRNLHYLKGGLYYKHNFAVAMCTITNSYFTSQQSRFQQLLH